MRLIDADALLAGLKEYHDSIMCDPEIGKEMKWREAVCFGNAVNVLVKQPTVDAIAMPKGRPGDYVEWDNGVEPYEPQLFQIMGIYIDSETVRYDLGYFCPTVNHPNIVRIIPHGERKDND